MLYDDIPPRMRANRHTRGTHDTETPDQDGAARAPTDTLSVPTLYCERCERTVTPHVYPRGPHLRADCTLCGRYLQFVAKTAAWQAAATEAR